MNNLNIIVKRFFTDMNGIIQDKATVPNAQKVKFPVWMFAPLDRDGGYNVAQSVKAPITGNYFLYSYLAQASYNFLDYQLGNDIKGQLKAGDIVLVFGDDPTLPTLLTQIVLHSETIAMGSLLELIKKGSYNFDSFTYKSDNSNNWGEPVGFTDIDNFGDIIDNSLSPYAYRDPMKNFLPDTIEVKLKGFAGFSRLMSTYILFATDVIELNFLISSYSQNNTQNINNGNSQAILFETR